LRTVFLGTSEWAATVLERLAASPHAPGLVVTRPDRPRGRGRRLAPPPVAEAARALGLPVAQPERVNDDAARAEIARARPEAVCVCAYGGLIREPLLSEHRMLNVHPSLLPRWRGAAPIERAILAGDDETGVCVMRLVAELDAGPVGLCAREPIGPQDTYGTLAERLAPLGGDLLVRALDEEPEYVPQPAEGATYAEKIERADRRLDPLAEDSFALDRRVRALTPHIGALLELEGGEPLGVRRARPGRTGPAPGELVAYDGGLVLGARTGALELLEVQPAGKRTMPAADFLRGHPRPG
jgi:methionyl-tRNA formyltransferase